MKILFDHPNPFLLAHGGFQIQIDQTKRALEQVGVEVEFLRWWDEKQSGDIIHFFGRPDAVYVELAHQKNIRVVILELLTGLGARSRSAVSMQRAIIRLARRYLPSWFWARMGWDAYGKADRIIALTDWEAHLMREVFDAPADRVTVIPNGVADEFLTPAGQSEARGKYLVCTATITQRKRVMETAQAAVQAQTPLWIIGRPYSEGDVYAQQFIAFVKEHSEVVRYEGAVEDRHQLAQIYRQARGFVLLSTQESLSLSALEAAACNCPLLLSDLPWARSVFGSDAQYCPLAPTTQTSAILRHFYDIAPQIKPVFQPLSWREVGERLKNVYEGLLSTSR